MATMTADQQVLKIARGFALPLDLVTEATAIVATRGAGKSSASAVIVEETFALGVQAVIFDRTGVYWGLRSNAKGDGAGLAIYVLGGPHGDVPLEPHAGVMIADLVVDSGHSFVLDLSDFSKGQAVRFAADFLDRLYDRKARARTTTLLVMDEAHFYAPQTPRGGFKGDSARLMGAMEDVVGLGRSRGLGVVLTTQRTQALNKAVLDLIETLLVMRMLSPRARAAVKDWIQEKHEDDEQGVIASLDSLPTGTAWVWSPLRGVLEKVALRRIKTFDAFKTPTAGEAMVEPTARKELDLDALGEQIRATAEKAKADDPAELRKRLRAAEDRAAGLEQQIEEWKRVAAEAESRVEQVTVEVPVASIEDLDAIWKLVTETSRVGDTLMERLQGAVDNLQGVVQPLATAILQAADAAEKPPVPPPPPRPAPPLPRPDRSAAVAVADSRSHHSAPVSVDGVVLNRKAERSVLAVLAQSPQGRSISATAILAGYSSKGGGFRGALSKLRTAGYIEGSSHLRITAAGLDAIAGQYEPLPTGRALLDYWLGQMSRAAERAVLQVAYDAGGEWVSIADVAERAGYEAAGGGFRGALSKLRTLELIEGKGNQGIRVTETLLG